ncbi:uncharacterized protein [Lolium perenne]|uniref:uncharacterized protein n=1 Tax=Lolium perenne TaxID=4522 RepID=UPI0021F67F27|nr:uncharacterized protein LOC127324951 [Lolium perenne]
MSQARPGPRSQSRAGAILCPLPRRGSRSPDAPPLVGCEAESDLYLRTPFLHRTRLARVIKELRRLAFSPTSSHASSRQVHCTGTLRLSHSKPPGGAPARHLHLCALDPPGKLPRTTSASGRGVWSRAPERAMQHIIHRIRPIYT